MKQRESHEEARLREDARQDLAPEKEQSIEQVVPAEGEEEASPPQSADDEKRSETGRGILMSFWKSSKSDNRQINYSYYLTMSHSPYGDTWVIFSKKLQKMKKLILVKFSYQYA